MIHEEWDEGDVHHTETTFTVRDIWEELTAPLRRVFSERERVGEPSGRSLSVSKRPPTIEVTTEGSVR